MSDQIDCISLWQPWATWVSWGWKPIETRTHKRFGGLAGKRIGIHAALKWDDEALIVAEPFLDWTQIKATLDAKYTMARGALLCTAFVESHRILTPIDAPCALIECETRRFGLVLRDIRSFLGAPLRMSGNRGIWKIEQP